MSHLEGYRLRQFVRDVLFVDKNGDSTELMACLWAARREWARAQGEYTIGRQMLVGDLAGQASKVLGVDLAQCREAAKEVLCDTAAGAVMREAARFRKELEAELDRQRLERMAAARRIG